MRAQSRKHLLEQKSKVLKGGKRRKEVGVASEEGGDDEHRVRNLARGQPTALPMRAETDFFTKAGGGVSGLSSRLERGAARHPGRLLKSTLQAMNWSQQPGAEPHGDRKPMVMFKYHQQAL